MSGKTLRLMCIVWPDDKPNDHIVQVKIDDDDTVAALKELIKDKYARRLHDIDSPDLVIWKCSIPADDKLQETLNTIRFHTTDTRVHRLPPASLLSKHFAIGLSPETIHVLVEIPALGECGTCISYSTTEAQMLRAENEAPPVSLPALLRERQRFSAELPTTAPSALGFPSDFCEFQEKQNQKIVWSRPRTADATIPVTLLHPIFRQFIDNCKNHQPMQEDNKLVLELMGAMSNFFPDENARAAELRAILTRHGIPVVTSTITSKGHHFPTDGAVAINGHLVAIIEVKREIGSKGAEPYAQVILYYSHSNATKSQEFLEFNFPSLLITVFGQTLLSSLTI